eukprot:Opistho-2@28126
MTIETETASGTSVCRIERPKQASYLFFTSFKLTLDGRNLDFAEFFGNSAVALPADNFVVDGNEVSSTAAFKGELARVFALVKPSPPAAETQAEGKQDAPKNINSASKQRPKRKVAPTPGKRRQEL